MFKIGDRVRIISKNIIGDITKINGNSNYIQTEIGVLAYCDENLELIAPQQSDRPVLGLVPQHIWRSQIVKLHKADRIKDISEAIKRYLDGELPVPPEWLDEYNDLLSERSGE